MFKTECVASLARRPVLLIDQINRVHCLVKLNPLPLSFAFSSPFCSYVSCTQQLSPRVLAHPSPWTLQLYISAEILERDASCERHQAHVNCLEAGT